MRSRVTIAIKVVLTALLLAWLVGRTDLASIGRAMAGADPAWVGAALLLHLAGYAITAWRWRLLLLIQGVDVPLTYLARACLVGVFFNNFLPSTVGGDVVRANETARFTGSGTRALTVVLVERFSGLIGLGLFAMVAAGSGLVVTGGGEPLLWGLFSGLAAGFAGLAVAAHPAVRVPLTARIGRLASSGGTRPGLAGKVLEKVGRLAGTLEVFAANPAGIGISLLLALVLQANVVLSYWFVSRSLGLPVSLAAHFLVVPVAILLLLLPVSINGIGARELIFVYLLGRFGVAAPDAVAFSFINYGLVLVQGVAGGVVYALRR